MLNIIIWVSIFLWSNFSYSMDKVPLAVYINKNYYGDVIFEVENNKLVSIKKNEFNELVKLSFSKFNLKQESYNEESEYLKISEIPLDFKFNSNELTVNLDPPLEWLNPKVESFKAKKNTYVLNDFIEREDFSFVTNYKVQVRNYKSNNEKNAWFETFSNYKKFTFENNFNYILSKLNRQNTKLTYDNPDALQRYEFFDVSYPVIGFLNFKNIFGISMYSENSLKDFSNHYESKSFEYVVERYSQVKTYVNNVLIKIEYLNPGKYSIKELPLNNGVNKIAVEVIDELKKTKTFTFNETKSFDLLKAGESQYMISSGRPDNLNLKNSRYGEKFYTLGFYKYGLNSNFTTSAYFANEGKFKMFGNENVLGNNLGIFSYGFAFSEFETKMGFSNRFTYQSNLQESNALSFFFDIEFQTKYFTQTENYIENIFDYNSHLKLGIPLFDNLNTALGVNLINNRINHKRYLNFDASVSASFYNHSASLYFSKSKNESDVWDNQVYIFFNFNFEGQKTYLSSFYDYKNKSEKLNITYDEGESVNNFRAGVYSDISNGSKNYMANLIYTDSLFEVGLSQDAYYFGNSQNEWSSEFNFSSSFCFVKNKTDSVFTISKPIHNSFAILKGVGELSDRPIDVLGFDFSNSYYGLKGTTLITQLTPYRNKIIQIDPNNSNELMSYEKESFRISPGFKSGQLISLKAKKSKTLKGVFKDSKNNILVFQAGVFVDEIGNKMPFFTNRNGEFVIEGVVANKGKVEFNNEIFDSLEINFSNYQSGIVELGFLVVTQKIIR